MHELKTRICFDNSMWSCKYRERDCPTFMVFPNMFKNGKKRENEHILGADVYSRFMVECFVRIGIVLFSNVFKARYVLCVDQSL